MTDHIDPVIMDLVRQAATLTHTTGDVELARQALEQLRLVTPEQHQAVLNFVNFKRCNIGDAARGIIWIEHKLKARLNG